MQFRPLWGFSLFTLAVLALLIGLGVWQLERREWKNALIAELESRSTADAVPLSSLMREAASAETSYAAVEFRAVSVRGHFLHDKEVHVFTQRDGVPGFMIFTPFAIEGTTPADIIFVDRGFVPDTLKSAETRAESQLEGSVEIRGLLRLPERPGVFTPEPDLAGNIWFGRDIMAMAAARGLERALPVYVEGADAPLPGGWPKGGTGLPELHTRHLEYALTWFSLALAVVVLYFAFHHQRGRLRFDARGPRT